MWAGVRVVRGGLSAFRRLVLSFLTKGLSRSKRQGLLRFLRSSVSCRRECGRVSQAQTGSFVNGFRRRGRTSCRTLSIGLKLGGGSRGGEVPL